MSFRHLSLTVDIFNMRTRQDHQPQGTFHLESGMRFYFPADIGVSAWLYDLRQVSPEALVGSTLCDQK